jgi:dual specificity phosphatase 12
MNELIEHAPGPGQEAFAYRKRNTAEITCTSWFLEEIPWIMASGQIQGKIICTSCQSKLGYYDLAGMQCSCGAWVAPCFAITKSKVDAEDVQ